MEFMDFVIISLAGFCSALIKTGVGVGAGIFLLPTLAMAYPAKIALGIGAPIMLVSDIIGLRMYWKQWVEKETLKKLLGSAIPGMIVGTILLPVISDTLFKIFIGVFGMIYAFNMLFPEFALAKFFKKGADVFNKNFEGKQVYIFGFGGGFATVLAHAGGLVWSLFMHTAIQDKRIFVGTIVLMFFLTNIYKTVAYIYIDILAVESLFAVLVATPGIFIGSVAGNMLNKKMNVNLFRKLVLILIFAVSFKLAV